MNGREAVKALMDGKTVTHPSLQSRFRLFKSEVLVLLPGDDIGYPWCFGLEGVVSRDDWELYEEPLSDERLIAEWMSRANDLLNRPLRECCDAAGARAEVYQACARQLRERKL